MLYCPVARENWGLKGGGKKIDIPSASSPFFCFRRKLNTNFHGNPPERVVSAEVARVKSGGFALFQLLNEFLNSSRRVFTEHTSGTHQRVNKTKMERVSLLLLVLGAVGGLSYMPHAKEHFFTDLLLRDMVDRMSKDLAAAADNYLELPESNRLQPSILSNRVIKDLENEETSDPVDFERLSNNPNPSLRDQEYLQHSSLWGHQFVAGGAGEGKQRLKPDGSVQNHEEIKTDSALPAYCNPPNPCPFEYTEEDDDCLEEFENTAAFSRDYQSSQDCMCDSEHMFECPVGDFQSHGNELDNDLDLDRIMEELSVEDQHKNLVAKKFHTKKDSNPFLKGEKLPVAAKKGNNLVGY